MGRTRDLFKKITDTKILRRGGKITQKNYTKEIFMTKVIIMV